MHRLTRLALLAFVFVWAAVALTLFGCGPAAKPRVEQASPEPTGDELKQKLDKALDYTFYKRRLKLGDQAAWQIMHGVLAFGPGFPVENNEGKIVSALEHVLAGGEMKGWTMRPGDMLESTGRIGLKAIPEPGTKTGQGHWDQWLGYMSDCKLPLDRPLKLGGDTFTIEDYVRQIQHDLPRNDTQPPEYSWTLMALTAYVPSDAKWKAFDGSDWSVERLVEVESEYDFAFGPCGGTHRLYGLTVALNRHVAAGGKIEGAWKKAQERVQAGLEHAQKHQNADGSFSVNYLIRPGTSPDAVQNLNSTGHVLEFVVAALPQDRLQEAWVKRAAAYLCDMFTATEAVSLECGALYHATHGLILYRDRVYGPREWKPEMLATTGK